LLANSDGDATKRSKHQGDVLAEEEFVEKWLNTLERECEKLFDGEFLLLSFARRRCFSVAIVRCDPRKEELTEGNQTSHPPVTSTTPMTTPHKPLANGKEAHTSGATPPTHCRASLLVMR